MFTGLPTTHLLVAAFRFKLADKNISCEVRHKLVPKPARMDLVSHKDLHVARLVPWG
jgi:hypothetical protein